ncbi:MAG: pilus assembly protein PilM [Gammaproteobacteria bacterium]|nr:pilus assembly protein PilM [Gammaproteobacteria bacterium]
MAKKRQFTVTATDGASTIFQLPDFLRGGASAATHFGLSVTPDGVACAQILHHDDSFEILDLRYLSTEDVSTLTLLKGLSAQFKLAKKGCHFAIPQTLYTLKMIETPNVAEEEMLDAVRWKVKEHIDYPLDEAVIDLFSIPGQAERKRPLMHYVVISRQSELQPLVDECEAAEVAIKVIDIQEMAIRNITASTPEDENGVAMIYLGKRLGELTITRQGELYLSRDLSLGTGQIQEMIDSLSGEEFEIESESGLALEVQGLVDKIVLETQRSIDYYTSHFGLPPINAVFVAPLVDPIDGLTAYLSESLGIITTKLDFNTLFAVSEAFDERIQGQCLMAVGAALRRDEG